MTFRIRVDRVSYDADGDTVVLGALLSGQYKEGDPVVISTEGGTWFTSVLFRNADNRWVIKGQPPDRDISTPCLAVSPPLNGVLPPRSVERSDLLDVPEFWATWYVLALHEERETLAMYFGVSGASMDRFYEDTMDSREFYAPWVSIRVPVVDGFSLEIEFSDEPPARYALYRDTWDRRIVLGYHSGHDSLPALRYYEVVDVARCIATHSRDERHRRSAFLLFFPGCIVPPAEKDDARSRLARAWRSLGVAQEKHIDRMVESMLEYSVGDVEWRQDPKRGWVNRSSRRNSSQNGRFGDETFARIAKFVEAIESH